MKNYSAVILAIIVIVIAGCSIEDDRPNVILVMTDDQGYGEAGVMPGKFVAVAWSPGLNPKGNSVAGTMALELLTTKTGLSVF